MFIIAQVTLIKYDFYLVHSALQLTKILSLCISRFYYFKYILCILRPTLCECLIDERVTYKKVYMNSMCSLNGFFVDELFALSQIHSVIGMNAFPRAFT